MSSSFTLLARESFPDRFESGARSIVALATPDPLQALVVDEVNGYPVGGFGVTVGERLKAATGRDLTLSEVSLGRLFEFGGDWALLEQTDAVGDALLLANPRLTESPPDWPEETWSVFRWTKRDGFTELGPEEYSAPFVRGSLDAGFRGYADADWLGFAAGTEPVALRALGGADTVTGSDAGDLLRGGRSDNGRATGETGRGRSA